MKACYPLLLLLLISSVIHAQDGTKYKSHPVVNPKINQASTYYDCIPPSDLDTHVITTGYDQYLLYLTWNMQTQYSEWVHWDDGVQYSGIGCCPSISAAARWDSGYLSDYHNYKIAKMRVILNDTALDCLIFKIWNGGYESDLIYFDTIHEYYAGAWIEQKLKSDIYINSDEELLVGYTAMGMAPGTFTLGTDDGPSIVGFGDLMRPDNDLTWDTLSNYDLEYNWNIQFYAEDTNGNQKQFSKSSGERNMGFLGYNLYQSINGSEYELLEFIPYESDSNFYALPLEASPDSHCYKLTALWVTPTDTCESTPAIAKNYPDQDNVCVLLVDNPENTLNLNDRTHCSPNPFSASTTIKYELAHPETVRVTFHNRFGILVDVIEQKQLPGLQQVVWTPKNLADGIYYFRMQAGEEVASGKVVLTR